MGPNANTHLVLLSLPAWGHTRPLLVLATRLILARNNIVVTILLPPNVLEKALSDVATQFESLGPSQKNARKRIRIVTTYTSDEQDLFKLLGGFVATYPTAYRTLLDGKSIVCAHSGTTFDPAPPPSVVILDLFALKQLRATRAITGNKVPILCWLSCTAAFTLRISAPEELGGMGDFGAQIDAEVLRSGRSEDEVSNEIFFATSGKVINIPGVPPMYDYEYFPQNVPSTEAPVATFTRQGNTAVRECDGLILTTFDKFENTGSLKALRSLLNGWGKDVYGVGPLLPIGYGSSALSSRGATDVEAFLESALEKHGRKSVIFISFGTVFWPADSEYIEELIEALIENSFPFIFCIASHWAKLSDDIVKKIELSQLGLLTKWAPQQYLLNHPAVSWFLTHGGQGGVTEALGSGIPLISWPITADQPTLSAHLSSNHHVLIELIEVRNSPHGKRPIHRLGGRTPLGTRAAVGAEIREVIGMLRGEKGREMQQNAARLRREFRESWEEGGDGRGEMEKFLGRYVDAERSGAGVELGRRGVGSGGVWKGRIGWFVEALWP